MFRLPYLRGTRRQSGCRSYRIRPSIARSLVARHRGTKCRDQSGLCELCRSTGKWPDTRGLAAIGEREAKKSGLPTGVIQRDFWLDVPAGGLKSLMKFATFPDNPTGSRLLTRFESPVNWNEDFGTRIRGYIHPPHRIF